MRVHVTGDSRNLFGRRDGCLTGRKRAEIRFRNVTGKNGWFRGEQKKRSHQQLLLRSNLQGEGRFSAVQMWDQDFEQRSLGFCLFVSRADLLLQSVKPFL